MTAEGLYKGVSIFRHLFLSVGVFVFDLGDTTQLITSCPCEAVSVNSQVSPCNAELSQAESVEHCSPFT